VPLRIQTSDHLACLIDIFSFPNAEELVRNVLAAAPGAMVVVLGAADPTRQAALRQAGARAVLPLPTEVARLVEILRDQHGLAFPRVPESITLPGSAEGFEDVTHEGGTGHGAVHTAEMPAEEVEALRNKGLKTDEGAPISEESASRSTTGLIARVRLLRQRRRADGGGSGEGSAELAREVAARTADSVAAAAFDDELSALRRREESALPTPPPTDPSNISDEDALVDDAVKEAELGIMRMARASQSQSGEAAGDEWDGPTRWDDHRTESATVLPTPGDVPPPPDLDAALGEVGFDDPSRVDEAFDAVFTEPTPPEGTAPASQHEHVLNHARTDEDAPLSSAGSALAPHSPAASHDFESETSDVTATVTPPDATTRVPASSELNIRRQRLAELHERTRPQAASQVGPAIDAPSSDEASVTAGHRIAGSMDEALAEHVDSELESRLRAAGDDVSLELLRRQESAHLERQAFEEQLKRDAQERTTALIEARAKEVEANARRDMEARIDAEMRRQAEAMAEERQALEHKIRSDAEARARELVEEKTREAEESARREMEIRIAEELEKKAARSEADARALEERIRREADARAQELVEEKTREAERTARREMETRIAEELARRDAEDARARAELEQRIRDAAHARTAQLLELQSREAEEKTRREMEARIADLLHERDRLDSAARAELEERIRLEAEARTQQLLAEKAYEAEEKTRREMEARIAAELERQVAATEVARTELEARIRAEAEARTQQLLEEKAREAEENARRDMDVRIATELARRKAEDDAARAVLEEKLRREAERRIQELLEQKAAEAAENTRREMEARIAEEMAKREATDAVERAELEQRIRAEAEERATALVVERSQEVEERTRRDIEERVEGELRRRQAEQDQARAAFESALREAMEARAEELLTAEVAAAEARLHDELRARTEQELAIELSRRDAEDARLRAEIETRVRAEAESRLQELLKIRITEAEARLKEVGDAQLEEEARRHAEEADRLRSLMELKVKEETEKRTQAAIEARLLELEEEVRRVAEQRARELLHRALAVKEEEEARLRQRLAFVTGRYDAVGPENAAYPSTMAVGSTPWTDAELLASPIGGQAFLPGGDAPLEPMLTERVIPLTPADGMCAEGEIPALLWSCHFLGVTGRVTFVHPDGRKRILFLEHGEPVGFSSDLGRDRPEEMLLRAGLITSRRYAELRAGPTMSARRLCAQLVQDGGIKTEEHFTAVRGVLTEQVLSLLEWDKARYAYDESRAHPEDRVRLVNRFDALLADGLRRKYDDARLWRVLGGPASIIGPERRALRLPPLGPGEIAAAKLLDGLRSLEDLLLEVPAPAEVILRTAFILLSCGGARMLARGLPVEPLDRRVAEERKVAIDMERVKDRLALARDGDYFAFMGLGPEATTTEVARAAKSLRERFDPRRYADPAFNEVRTALVEIQDVISEAEVVLGDPGLRAAYHQRRRRADEVARRAV